MWLVRRLLLVLPVLAGVVLTSFFVIHLVPGDPVDVILGEQATSVDRDALREQLGLNDPLPVQLKKFVVGALHFDFGRSLTSGRPVLIELSQRFPATVELALVALVFSVVVGITLGVLSAIHRGTWIDRASAALAFMGMSVPTFWLAPMLVWVFAIELDLLPVSERAGISSVILPALSLSLSLVAVILRTTRASMLEVLSEDYIRTARAKGAQPVAIYFKHALRNALTPVLTVVGLQVGSLFTGAVVVETIFDWPGVGTFLFHAIEQRDYPVVQGCVLLGAFIYVLAQLLTDISYSIAQPQVRLL